jgi:hypothetical protein
MSADLLFARLRNLEAARSVGGGDHTSRNLIAQARDALARGDLDRAHECLLAAERLDADERGAAALPDARAGRSPAPAFPTSCNSNQTRRRTTPC